MKRLLTSIFLASILIGLKKLLIIFGLWISSYTVALSASEPNIGMIISTQGQVIARDKQNNQRTLKRRSKINLHDKIITQKDSKAQLRLKDDSVIVVQSSSEFYVSEFAFNRRSPHKSKYVGNIVKGALINISGQGKTENYKLNSPIITIAFRGTGLATKLISKRNVILNQDVYVFQGYVTVKNRCENVAGFCEPRTINIGAGQKTNAATVDMSGKVESFQSTGLISNKPGGISLDKVLMKEGGSVTIRCKGR